VHIIRALAPGCLDSEQEKGADSQWAQELKPDGVLFDTPLSQSVCKFHFVPESSVICGGFAELS
jgi:hypothetical protein